MKAVLAIQLVLALGYCSELIPFGDDRPRIKRYHSNSCADENCRLKDSYDFIIVGGGTAGCVVASRLSEIAAFSVLMIEAGGEEGYETQIPFFFEAAQKSRFDWNYTSTQQKNMCLSNGGFCDLPRGRLLGGCSSIDYAVYTTGNLRDFDGWAALGNPTWSWNEILPYFQKEERYLACDRDGGSLGRCGPVAINENEPYWLTPYILSALGSDIGLPRALLNDGVAGYDTAKVTIYNGERVSSNKAYIQPVVSRPNLDIMTQSLVTKVIISNKVATGVEFVYGGVTYTVSARREVILSAGVISSPQILMLSGVGPANHLREFNIPVVHDLPGVGWNLHDHPGILLSFRMNQVEDESNIDFLNWMNQYLANKTGPITLSRGGLMLVSISANSSLATLENFDMAFQAGLGLEQNIVSISGLVSTPQSRGSVRLRSNSPFDKPCVDPNYLSCQYDLEIMKQLAFFMFRLADSPTMRKLGASAATYISDDHPDCIGSTDLYGCIARNYGVSQNSLVGTCKMGPPSDPYSVVNWELKVYGIGGLRVVDGSVMPFITSSTLLGPTLMIAEKASDMIKNDHRCC